MLCRAHGSVLTNTHQIAGRLQSKSIEQIPLLSLAGGLRIKGAGYRDLLARFGHVVKLTPCAGVELRKHGRKPVDPGKLGIAAGKAYWKIEASEDGSGECLIP